MEHAGIGTDYTCFGAWGSHRYLIVSWAILAIKKAIQESQKPIGFNRERNQKPSCDSVKRSALNMGSELCILLIQQEWIFDLCLTGFIND